MSAAQRGRLAFQLFLVLLVSSSLLSAAKTASRTEEDVYEQDVRVALDELEKQCGHFFKTKKIDWARVRRQFLAEVEEVESDSEHLVLLVRLLARLRDGHARVVPLEKGKDVEWPDDGRAGWVGPGMFWCRVGKKVYVKNAWSSAAGNGIEPGMEVLKVDDRPAAKWLEDKLEELSDLKSFSTDQHALFYTLHRGLAAPPATRLELEIRDLKKKKKKRTITYNKASVVPDGPAFLPEGLTIEKDVKYGTTEEGHGYVHVRRCKGNLPELMDRALAALGEVPGLILDFRGNSGGGFDHDALLGRFIPEGEKISFSGKTIGSAGPRTYGGPIVVIVDATVVSAGETGSGMFKEEGRAYMIGESPTAGMSASKTTIELPSGLFGLYVAIHSNKSRYQGGRGIEGIGIEPHEIVAFDPKDLAAKRDTLILRAEALLEKFPQNKVPYDPRKFGWQPPRR